MRCVKLRNFLGFCLTWIVGYDMKVIFRQLQANKLSFWWYIYGKERLLFNILPKSQNRYLTPPTPIFRSSSKQPEGTANSFCGGRSHSWIPYHFQMIFFSPLFISCVSSANWDILCSTLFIQIPLIALSSRIMTAKISTHKINMYSNSSYRSNSPNWPNFEQFFNFVSLYFLFVFCFDRFLPYCWAKPAHELK